ncbi:hypothetical protein Tco_0898035 [Tanacetum coccineum]
MKINKCRVAAATVAAASSIAVYASLISWHAFDMDHLRVIEKKQLLLHRRLLLLYYPGMLIDHGHLMVIENNSVFDSNENETAKSTEEPNAIQFLGSPKMLKKILKMVKLGCCFLQVCAHLQLELAEALQFEASERERQSFLRNLLNNKESLTKKTLRNLRKK